MERSGNFYKAIRLGYILISILIGCMAYRMITYATKPKEVRDRLKREQTTHLGTDLLENEED